MLRLLLVPLVLVPGVASCLRAQHPPLPLCIVQTKPNQATDYDPSAGPWAIEMYNQLSGQKLRSGAPLKITVLPASDKKDILPEIRRLQCVWVVQLWYFEEDPTSSHAAVSSGGPTPRSALNPQLVYPQPKDSLFFSLWNADTQKVLERGSAPLHPTERLSSPGASNVMPSVGLVRQILKRLDELH